VTVELI